MYLMNRCLLTVLSLTLALSMTTVAFAADATADAPAEANARLPQSEANQQVLRQYMATLTEKDFDHGVTAHLTVPPTNPDLDYQYRTYIMSMLQQPHVGGKRGIGAVNSPSKNFLLSTIEGSKDIIVPPVWEEALSTFIKWDSPGNLYHDNRALKMRTFVAAAVKLMMINDFYAANAGSGILRADWNGYHLITAASAYPVFKDELPAPVQKAYEAGLVRLGRHLLANGPTGQEPDYELGAAVGLWYASQAVDDDSFAADAKAYAHKLCTDPRYFHPAGYWNEVGGVDVGFGGMANFWAVWLALASDWPFANEAVDKIYKLRSHLSLPEPNGAVTGPTAFNNRIGSPASEDQWDWDGARDQGAAMITDHALWLMNIPTAEQLEGAMAVRTGTFNGHLYGSLRNAPYTHPTGERYLGGDSKTGRYLKNDEIKGYRWKWRLFPNGWNYPIEVNPAYEFYRPGAYAHLMELQKQNSPMLTSPYLRPGNAIENFSDAFITAKQPTFAAILHVGPVGNPAPEDGMSQYKGPLGFGGGQLSAFWTPAGGSVILGRRSAITMRGENTLNLDKFEEWRLWPIHAVSGETTAGMLFTSARIASPEVTTDVKSNKAVVKVAGTIPQTLSGQEGSLAGSIAYARTFTIDAKGVGVETTITGDGKDQVAELYETLPLFLNDTKMAKGLTLAEVTIEFQAGGKWAPATDAFVDNVQAVRVTRYEGKVQVTFASPQRVKLSPTEWKDKYLTRAVCRNVMVDLMKTGDKPGAIKDTRTVSYRIEAVK